MKRRKILIDTDPGIDDAMAIHLALRSPELEVIALTTVFGNVNVELATTNALRLIDLAGHPEVVVAQGASGPEQGTFEGVLAVVHGDDGQGNSWRPESALEPVSESAGELIVNRVMAEPGELTLVAVGPLTNLSRALVIEPRIIEAVREVVIMGGNALCPGNATPAAEANMFCDPEAADRVFGAGWALTMVGLDVTHKVLMRDPDLASISAIQDPLAQHIASIVPFYRDFFRTTNSVEGIYVHDSTAIAYLLAPELFTTRSWPVRVDCSQGIGRGKTWPSLGAVDEEDREALKLWRERPSIQVCVDVRGAEVVELCLEKIGARET